MTLLPTRYARMRVVYTRGARNALTACRLMTAHSGARAHAANVGHLEPAAIKLCLHPH